MAYTPKYHVVLQAAVRSDRSTRRISTQRVWQSVWPDRTVHIGVVERYTLRRLLWKSSMVSKKERGFRDRTTFAPSGQNRRSERQPVIRPRCTSTSDLTRTHQAITFNLCSSWSLNRQTFGDRPRGARAPLKYIYISGTSTPPEEEREDTRRGCARARARISIRTGNATSRTARGEICFWGSWKRRVKIDWMRDENRREMKRGLRL